jgi:hypothetical protein
LLIIILAIFIIVKIIIFLILIILLNLHDSSLIESGCNIRPKNLGLVAIPDLRAFVGLATRPCHESVITN